jgi:hypothetical protein
MMGVLHPTRRIDALNRGNLVEVRQIESASILAAASDLGHIDQYDQT